MIEYIISLLNYYSRKIKIKILLQILIVFLNFAIPKLCYSIWENIQFTSLSKKVYIDNQICIDKWSFLKHDDSNNLQTLFKKSSKKNFPSNLMKISQSFHVSSIQSDIEKSYEKKKICRLPTKFDFINSFLMYTKIIYTSFSVINSNPSLLLNLSYSELQELVLHYSNNYEIKFLSFFLDRFEIFNRAIFEFSSPTDYSKSEIESFLTGSYDKKRINIKNFHYLYNKIQIDTLYSKNKISINKFGDHLKIKYRNMFLYNSFFLNFFSNINNYQLRISKVIKLNNLIKKATANNYTNSQKLYFRQNKKIFNENFIYSFFQLYNEEKNNILYETLSDLGTFDSGEKLNKMVMKYNSDQLKTFWNIVRCKKVNHYCFNSLLNKIDYSKPYLNDYLNLSNENIENFNQHFHLNLKFETTNKLSIGSKKFFINNNIPFPIYYNTNKLKEKLKNIFHSFFDATLFIIFNGFHLPMSVVRYNNNKRCVSSNDQLDKYDKEKLDYILSDNELKNSSDFVNARECSCCYGLNIFKLKISKISFLKKYKFLNFYEKKESEENSTSTYENNIKYFNKQRKSLLREKYYFNITRLVGLFFSNQRSRYTIGKILSKIDMVQTSLTFLFNQNNYSSLNFKENILKLLKENSQNYMYSRHLKLFGKNAMGNLFYMKILESIGYKYYQNGNFNYIIDKIKVNSFVYPFLCINCFCTNLSFFSMVISWLSDFSF